MPTCMGCIMPKQKEVGERIVILLLVDVMDTLFSTQTSANLPLNNGAVHTDALILFARTYIPITKHHAHRPAAVPFSAYHARIIFRCFSLVPGNHAELSAANVLPGLGGSNVDPSWHTYCLGSGTKSSNPASEPPALP